MHQCLPKASSANSASSLLRKAAHCRSLPDGRLLHDQLIRSGQTTDTYIGNSLTEMYAHLGSAQEAKSVFDRNPNPNLYAWNVLIKAYGLLGLHQDACSVFFHMPVRDVISWTSIICLLAQHGYCAAALHIYNQMHVEGFQPNKITLVGALHACANEHSQLQGFAIHIAALEFEYDRDLVIATALIKMYGEWGNLQVSWSVFDSMRVRDVISWNSMIGVILQAGDYSSATHMFWKAPERNAASWNTMISAYLQGGNAKLALGMFHTMARMGPEPNEITFICAVNACAGVPSLEDGRSIHITLVKLGVNGVEVENSLISMYGKCKNLAEARSVFKSMYRRDVVSWTAIIVACAENGQVEEALSLFQRMQSKGVEADEVVLFCCLDACSILSSLVGGECINDTIVKLGLEEHEMVKTALIDMYGKCGSLDEARHIFYKYPSTNVTTWNALMTSYSHRVHIDEVLHLLQEMWQSSIKANSITFSCILTACSHAGWVNEVNQVFLMIHFSYGSTHTEDHFLSMTDLLARAGQLEKAAMLIQNFPFRHDEGLAWQCLLAACKTHDNVEQAVRVAKFDL